MTESFLPKFAQEDFFIAGKFLFFFLIAFAAIYSISLFFGLQFFEWIAAAPTAFFLWLAGKPVELVHGEPILLFIEGFDFPIAISELCTGLLEWAVLCAAILASTEAPAKKRAFGVLAGTVGIYIFNLFRINASIFSIMHFGLGFAEFSHDVFFRVFLFISIAGFYYAWLRYAQKQT